MIKPTIIAIGVALGIALAAYGLSQGGGSGPSHAPTTYEEQVIQRLHLTASQTKQYDELHAWLKRETEAMYKLPHDKIVPRGWEINHQWKEGLQKTFTKAQWDLYCKLWEPDRPVASKESGTKPAMSTDWAGTEERILGTLHLSAEQKTRIRALQKDLDRENQELKELWNGSDPDAIGRKSSEINKHVRSGMRAILDDEQWKSYMKQWDDLMQPLIRGNHGTMRPLPRGLGGTPPPSH